MGQPIAVIGEEGDDTSGAEALASESEAPPPKKEEKKPEPAKEPESKPPKGGSDQAQAPKGTTSALQTPGDEERYGSGGGTDAPKAPELQGQGDKPKFFASPLARKLALERGVPLSEIKGSGPEGRIVKSDIEKYSGKPASSSATSPSSASSTLPGQAAPVAPSEYEDIPVTNMRRTIGKRLTESKQQLPHYYLTVEINMGESDEGCGAQLIGRPHQQAQRNVQQGRRGQAQALGQRL